MAGSEPGSAVQLLQMDLGSPGHAAEGSREGFLVGFASGGSPLFCTTTQGLVCGGFRGGWVHCLPLEVHFQPFPTAFGTGVKLISLCCIFPVPC